jgi:hypothetical protein
MTDPQDAGAGEPRPDAVLIVPGLAALERQTPSHRLQGLIDAGVINSKDPDQVLFAEAFVRHLVALNEAFAVSPSDGGPAATIAEPATPEQKSGLTSAKAWAVVSEEEDAHEDVYFAVHQVFVGHGAQWQAEAMCRRLLDERERKNELRKQFLNEIRCPSWLGEYATGQSDAFMKRCEEAGIPITTDLKEYRVEETTVSWQAEEISGGAGKNS